MQKSNNIFFDEVTGIRIVKLDNWDFYPTNWLEVGKNTFLNFNSSEEDFINEMMFCIQCTSAEDNSICAQINGNIIVSRNVPFSYIRNRLIGELEKVYDSVEVLEDTDDFIISGKQGASIILKVTINHDGIEYTCRVQNLIIPLNGYTFIIAFASDWKVDYKYYEEQIQIVRSLRFNL